jgi:hypothetical protein
MRLSIFVIAVSALALAAPAQRLPWAGHWKFDETAGTIAKDSAFHANDGTLIGYPVPSWLAGKLGKFGAVFAGCRLYTPLQSMESVAIGIIGSQGNSANLSLKIPNNNWLACRMVSFQGATVGGNPPVAGFSNGATVLIGR